MFTTRWQPWNEVVSEMNRLQGDMNRLFGRLGTPRATHPFPGINVWEDDEKLFVEAELPGLELADLEIYVTGGNQLMIKGERREPHVEKGTWHRQERGYGKFSRVFELPADVDADQVNASFRHGVLLIEMPKREEVKPRRIEVRTE